MLIRFIFFSLFGALDCTKIDDSLFLLPAAGKIKEECISIIVQNELSDVDEYGTFMRPTNIYTR
jgi:hypothetical protein